MNVDNREERSKKRKSKKKKHKFILIIIWAFLALLMVYGTVTGINIYRNIQPSADSDTPTQIEGIPVIVDLLPEGIPGRIGQKMKIQYIVIHETGNPGTNANALAHNTYLHKEALSIPISWHYTVDDHEIYKHLPDNEVGFHAGDQYRENGGNMNGIGIEMCINPENDYDQTLQNTAALVRYLLVQHDLTIKEVKKHQDFSGKNCPQNLIVSDRWEEFLKMI